MKQIEKSLSVLNYFFYISYIRNQCAETKRTLSNFLIVIVADAMMTCCAELLLNRNDDDDTLHNKFAAAHKWKYQNLFTRSLCYCVCCAMLRCQNCDRYSHAKFTIFPSKSRTIAKPRAREHVIAT